MAVDDCGGIWRRVISQDEPENAVNTATLEVLHDFKRRPSQTVTQTVAQTVTQPNANQNPNPSSSPSAAVTVPQLVAVGVEEDVARRHSYVSDPRPSSVDAVQRLKKAPRVVKQVSQASAPTKPSIGEIGLDIMKIQSGMKGFRQLQKVATLVATPSPTETSAKKSISAHNMSAMLADTRCQLCEEEGGQRPRLCSHSSAMHARRKASPPTAAAAAAAAAATQTRSKLSSKHRIPTIFMEPSDDHNHGDAADASSAPASATPAGARGKMPNAGSAALVGEVARSGPGPCCDERTPIKCEDASCKFDFPVPPMRRFSVFLQAPKMRSEENSFEQSNSCGIGLGLSGISIGYRLGRRKTLYKRRRFIADYLLAIATLGVILAIIETEMTVVGIYSKESMYSFCVKSMISLSTFVLLLLLCLFHVLEIQVRNM